MLDDGDYLGSSACSLSSNAPRRPLVVKSTTVPATNKTKVAAMMHIFTTRFTVSDGGFCTVDWLLTSLASPMLILTAAPRYDDIFLLLWT